MARIAFVLAAIGLACSPPDSALEAQIAKAVAQGEGATLQMSRVADFDWDRFHVFPPYTPSQDVDQQLGFHWSAAESTGIHELDSITLLVFVRDSNVVAYVTLPRRDGDFSDIKHPGGFSREEAIFVVRREYRGEPWLVVYEQARPPA